jgi:iron complex outermembrane recepter protein
MTSNQIPRAVRRALWLAALGAASASVPVYAQDQEQDQDQDDAAGVQTVVVTGSRIARDDFTSESPITVVTSEALIESGQVDLGEALRTQMAVTAGGFSKSSNLSGGGAQAIDLRNLGTDRVLTLINGRRISRYADALQNESVDLSLIPIAMIERVEILRDGASAIYGADAVSGVVNIIMKDDFEGFQLTAGSGISGYSDAEEWNVQGVLGMNGEEGNLTLSAEYKFRDNVPQREREWGLPSIAGLSATGVTNGSGAHPGGTIVFPTAPMGTGWCTQPRVLGGDERTNVFGSPACPSQAPSSATALIGRYDYALVQDIINQEKQINTAALGTRHFGNSATGFLEMMYSRRNSESQLDGNPVFAGQGTPAFPLGWVVPANNPHNPFPGEEAQVTQRPTSTIGPRSQTFEAQLLRTVVGIRGEDLFNRLNWEVSYTNSEVVGHSQTNSTFNLRRAITISDPTLCAADPICTGALAPGNTALDVYRPANWAASEIGYMRQISTTDAEFDLQGVQAILSGDLFPLPAGDAGFAIGVEYREESASFKPDSVTEAGESIANQTFSTRGDFDVNEAFAELNFPLLRDAPGAQELTVNLQGRYFDYSTFGDDTVYKAGLNYAPVEALRIRGTIGTSFRAPTLVDSFSGGTVSFDFITDPCNQWDTSGNATLIANCGPGGANLPAGFTQNAQQLPVLAGGDLADGVQNLTPEEADTWTVGVVFQPAFLQGLRLSADYWDIVVSNFIDRPDIETEVVFPCYNSANRSAAECSLFQRNPVSGNLTNLVSGAFNRIGEVKTNGVDWQLSYSGIQIGNGKLSLDHHGTYVMEYEQPGVTVGPGEVDFGSPFSVPDIRLNFMADYEIGSVSLGWRTRMVGELDAINCFNGPCTVNADGANFLGYDGADALWEHDLRARWQATDTFEASLGVNNIFDEEPPYIFATGNNTDVGLYPTAVVGRFYFLRLKADF